MAVTIKDIAERAGVSFSTVSKALRNSPLVQESTKQKIVSVAQSMGYQPNFTARRLVSKKSGVIGVVWPSVERSTLSTLITNINDRLEKLGYTTLLSINRSESAVEAFHRFQVDAILMFQDIRFPAGGSPPFRTNIPILHYGIAGTGGCLTVDVNRGKAIELALDHLLKLGHRSVAYIGAPSYADPLQDQKVAAYREFLLRNGLDDRVIQIEGMESHDGYMAAKSLFMVSESSFRPTAIVSGSYDLTKGIVRAAEECGIPIPDRLSIVCYDNFKQADNLEFPVTAVGVEFDEISETISKTLMRMIDDSGDGDRTPIFLEPELVVRSSTAAVIRR